MRETHQDPMAIGPMTVEEYIRFEWTAECRHEYIDGKLFEMPGAKIIHSKIKGNILIFLYEQLIAKGFEVYSTDVKVSNYNRTNYYYPDIFATREAQTKANEYIQYEPEIIVEVISSSSRITDTIDKYIDYTLIPSLKYYLVVEPEITYVILYAKNGGDKWEATLFSSLTDIIPLPLLELSLPLTEVYK